jgi:hypothetical protein
MNFNTNSGIVDCYAPYRARSDVVLGGGYIYGIGQSLVYKMGPTNTPIVAATMTLTLTPTRTSTMGAVATKTITKTITPTSTVTQTLTYTTSPTSTATPYYTPTPDLTPHYVFNGAAVVYNGTVSITSQNGILTLSNEYNMLLQGMATMRSGPLDALEAGLAIDARTITITVCSFSGGYVDCSVSPCAVDLTLYQRKIDAPW